MHSRRGGMEQDGRLSEEDLVILHGADFVENLRAWSDMPIVDQYHYVDQFLSEIERLQSGTHR